MKDLLEIVMEISGFNLRFTKADCSISDKNSTSEHFWFVTAYSRIYASLNFGYNLKRDLNNFYVDDDNQFKRTLPLVMSIFYRLNIILDYGAIYREVFKAEVEWCSLIKTASKNFLFDMDGNMIRATAPEVTHEYPYMVKIIIKHYLLLLLILCLFQGYVKVTNLTLNISKILSVYPQGDYRSHW